MELGGCCVAGVLLALCSTGIFWRLVWFWTATRCEGKNSSTAWHAYSGFFPKQFQQMCLCGGTPACPILSWTRKFILFVSFSIFHWQNDSSLAPQGHWRRNCWETSSLRYRLKMKWGYLREWDSNLGPRHGSPGFYHRARPVFGNSQQFEPIQASWRRRNRFIMCNGQ